MGRLLTDATVAAGQPSLANTVVTIQGNVNAIAVPVSSVNYPHIATGTKTFAAAGTAEQLPAQTIPMGKNVLLTALLSNAGTIYLADTKAKAETAGQRKSLNSGDSLSLALTDLSVLWLNGTNGGDGLDYVVEVL